MKSEQFDNIKQIELRTRRIIELLTSMSGCNCSAELKAILAELQDIDNKLVVTNSTLANIYNSVDDVESLITTTNTYLSNIDTNIANIDALLTNIDTNIQDLEVLLTSIDNTTTNMDSTLSNIDSTLVNMDSTLTGISTILSTIQTDVASINVYMGNIDANIASILSYIANIDTNVTGIYNFISSPSPLSFHNILQFDYTAPFFGATSSGIYSVAFIFHSGGAGTINGLFYDETFPPIIFTANSQHRQALPSINFSVTSGQLRIIEMQY
jgi:predicted  nucleic acid-binding Zn-ribbon protein